MQIYGKILSLAGLAVCLGAGPATAHHSFAMFDQTKYVTKSGTIKELQWTNPHSWVQMMIADPVTGKPVEWSIETGSTIGLSKQGWTRDTAKPGDKAVVEINVLRSGEPGGALHSMTINGKRYTTSR